MPANKGSDSGANDSATQSGQALRSVLAALLLLLAAMAAKVVVVTLALVGGGILGHSLAGRPGLIIGVTAGAAVAVVGCHALITRTRESASVLHEAAADAAVWTAAGWLIAMGWLLGDAVSDTAAVIGVLLAALLVGVVGLAVASRLDGSLVAAIRSHSGDRDPADADGLSSHPPTEDGRG